MDKEILLKFFESTEKHYVNRTPFHFRCRAEAVLWRAARLRKAFSTGCGNTPKKIVLYVDLRRAI